MEKENSWAWKMDVMGKMGRWEAGEEEKWGKAFIVAWKEWCGFWGTVCGLWWEGDSRVGKLGVALVCWGGRC